MSISFNGTVDELITLMKNNSIDIQEIKTTSNGTTQLHTAGKLIINFSSNTKSIWLQGQHGETETVKAILNRATAPNAPTDTHLIQEATSNIAPKGTEVFLVHGHDQNARDQLELVLRRLGMTPFILQDNSSSGLTIIEALHKHIAQPGLRAGIVLMTPDDWGYSVSEKPEDRKPRARQNVVLELGMLLGCLDRKNIIVLQKGNIEPPSDIAGLLYIPFIENAKEAAPKLAQRLKEIGFNFTHEQLLTTGQ